MSKRRNLVVDLIDAYHNNDKPPLLSSSLSDREVAHLYDFGFSSIALCTLNSGLAEMSRQSQELLQSADLTARVLYRQIRTAAAEILEIARNHGIPLVLLKGIAIAQDLYAEPHHRIMGDVDVLVPVAHAAELHTLLSKAGFLVEDDPEIPDLPEGHHHLPVLRHPLSGVPIEIHTSLFSRTPPSAEGLFQTREIWNQVQPAEIDGSTCLRFRPEFQLVYTIAHWAMDHKISVNIISINDVVLMLRRHNPELDWRLIDSWLSNSPLLANYFAVILIFLRDVGIAQVPTPVESHIAAAERRIGTINLKILHWILMTFPLSGREKVGWAVTSTNARIIWRTLLEPRHKSLQIIVAVKRILFRRTPGRSLLHSTVGRIRTLLEPNR